MRNGASTQISPAMNPSRRLPSPLVSADQNGFQIEDGGTIDRLQMPNSNVGALDIENLHAMETDRIRTVCGTCCEHTSHWVGRVIPGMDDQQIAAGAIEPRQYEYFIALAKIADALRECGVDNQ
jgi:hypothetical protein